ncbi:hypothetical protein pipiens_013315 [Culex pipiens pipiens]|uniref:Uncharacterized protein n=1 Tax=Culex pipiens pipiens TaxID=38569 RepID=A0ABD1CYW0_CULPP
MHVRQFKQHGYRRADGAKRYFNWTASVSYVFEAFVGDRLPEESSYEIVLNIVMKRHDICVNGSMVKEGFGAGVVVKAAEQKSVEEAGNRTLGSRSATSEGQQRTTSRLTVRFCGRSIRNVVEDKEPGDKTDWKKGECCLVLPTMVSKGPDKNGHIACEYYRAQVIDYLDDSMFTVFLIT